MSFPGLEATDSHRLKRLSATWHATAPIVGANGSYVEAVAAWLDKFVADVLVGTTAGAPSPDPHRDAAFALAVDCVDEVLRQAQESDRPQLQLLRQQCDDILECGEPLNDMFSEVNSLAAGLYGLEAPWRLDLDVGKLVEGLGRTGRNQDFDLTAVTHRSKNLVQLRVPLDRFGPKAFLLVPFVLGHELIAHVYAGHPDTDNHSVFAEGLSDWLAHYVLDRSMPTVLPQCADVARIQGRLFRADSIRTRAERHLGELAAQRAVRFFETTGFEIDAARTLTARMVTSISKLDCGLADKDYLAVRLTALEQDSDLQRRLRTWIEDRNDADLLF